MAEIKTISTKNAFLPAGPYSQATVANGFVYVSGQVPGTPEGDIVKGSIGDKTEAAIANVKAILEAAGSSLDKTVRVGVFLTDMQRDFKGMNEVFAKHFTHKPARTTVQVSALPLGVEVEIEAIALV